MNEVNRREFLEGSVGTAIGFSMSLAAIGEPRRSRAASAQDKVILAGIGLGGRGTALMKGFAGRPDVEFAYLCDPDASRAASAAQWLKSNGKKSPQVLADFRRALDDKAVDGVVIATPDHWHALATVLACQAGKDVYVEKPASHNIWEGRRMVEAARKYQRIVQVGTQSRSAPYCLSALDYIRSGKLGDIRLCKVFNLKSGDPHRHPPDGKAAPAGVDYDLWLGPAPKRPFNPARFHGGWYVYWDYCGGDMGNDGVHQIDLARWLIGKDYPKSVSSTGGNLAYRDDREVPDTEIATFDFGDLLMTFELTQWAPYMDKIAQDIRDGDLFPYWPQCATRIELYGTKGLMFVGRHGGGWQVFKGPKVQSRPGELVAQAFGRFPDPEHQANFIECVRSRKAPNADVEEGHRSAVLVHAGNISCRLGGRKLTFDAKNERFVGDEEANRLVKREFRAPYVIPDRV